MAPRAHIGHGYSVKEHCPHSLEASHSSSLGLMTVLMEVRGHIAGTIQLVPHNQTLFDLDLLQLLKSQDAAPEYHLCLCAL